MNIVLIDINSVPKAGDNNIPILYNIPAASDIAKTLCSVAHDSYLNLGKK